MAESLHDIVKRIDDLVSMPGIFVRLNRMVDDPRYSVQEIGEVIAQDPALTVRLLRMANSVIYGFSSEIETVPRAVMVIGTRRVRDLALATSSIEVFEGIPNDLVTMENFWMHSIYCGLIASHLARESGLREPDTLFVAGLLHDIGQLVMYSQLPEESRAALELSLDDANPMPLYLAEHQQIGFDHAQLGGALARHWQLPAVLAECIEYHHQPDQASEFPRQTAIVHIANTLAVLAELNAGQVEETDAPAIEPAAWQQAGLEESVIPEALAEAHRQFSEVSALLLGQSVKT